MNKPIAMKPHHFLDIIKLYGAGRELFVPDTAYGHDFYRIANLILQQKDTLLIPVTGADAICEPCIHLGAGGTCTDSLTGIPNYASKHEWNVTIDARILELSDLSAEEACTAEVFCRHLYAILENIPLIWREEHIQKTKSRFQYFCRGAKKYLACL